MRNIWPTAQGFSEFPDGDDPWEADACMVDAILMGMHVLNGTPLTDDELLVLRSEMMALGLFAVGGTTLDKGRRYVESKGYKIEGYAPYGSQLETEFGIHKTMSRHRSYHRGHTMPDLIDQLGEQLARLLGAAGPRTIISEAPGGGPEADRESNRTHRAGRIGEHITHGRDALGFGGHGDAVTTVEQPDADVAEAVRRAVRNAQRKGLHQPKPAGRIRLAQPFSPEAHIGSNWQFLTGPYSPLDCTVGAPGAGNSTQQIPVALPVNIPSPVMLLDRYPGALYMSVFVRSFAFMPTATGMTGLQELFFIDAGGAVAGLGIYNPATVGSAIYQNIGALCNSPLTDPGNTVLGALTVNNIGIGGTPGSPRRQLPGSFVAFYTHSPV